jgi:hypothetical protein
MCALATVFDVVVCGGTAPGIVAAVRAAREGLTVALVVPGQWLGGSLPSLGAVETHYRGWRAPLLDEFIAAVHAHYRASAGENSAAYRICAGGKMTTFEPHVAEAILERMVAAAGGLRVWRGYAPVAVESRDREIQTVRFQNGSTGEPLRLGGRAFVEAGYEGDLMALAGVSHRIGREDRGECGEPRAGRVFTRWLTGEHPRAAVEGRLNLVTAGATTSEPLPGSTGEGDDQIQSYSYRLCVTDDPDNRRLLASPPDGYDRSSYAPILLSPEEKEHLKLPFHHRFLIYSLREMAERDHLFHGHALPNCKRSWNATNLTGQGQAYAAADMATRQEIARRHLHHALGLMWFLQNDEAMPADLRARAREWGLACDEFVDTDNVPPQLYIREARRMVGRARFTEHDALLAPGHERAPVHGDSIGITEFSLDSLACTTERRPGTLCDGQLFQMEVSRPGQVPFGVLLPRELDNLLVVTTVSATHVGWGTIRQTPTLMHLAESAAWATVLGHQKGIPPALVDVTQLQRTLVEHGVMITFYNEFDMSTREPWVPAVQFWGTRGFFPSYDARPDELLDEVTAQEWARRAGVPINLLLGRTRGDACFAAYTAVAAGVR